MDAMALIERELAKPATHVVLTTYADGGTYRFEARSLAAAENYAKGEGRKIGRDLISRTDGSTVRITAVEIAPIA